LIRQSNVIGVLERKVAVITGGTQGFGGAVAHAYVKEEAVVFSARVKGCYPEIAALGFRSSSVAGSIYDIRLKEEVACKN
jgi:NAD(P)-dependent dehydrogenase (short-subunit alcohol dehydrogenase family)